MATRKKAKKSGAAPRRKAPRKTAKKTAGKRKAAPRKKASARKKRLAGEGDYEASRTFLREQAAFVKKNKARIPAMGKAARAALEGPEGKALRAAEARARGAAAGEPATEPGAFVIPPG